MFQLEAIPQSDVKPRQQFSPEREAILGVLFRIHRRMRLNGALRDLALIGGLLVFSLLTWRLLRVFGEAAAGGLSCHSPYGDPDMDRRARVARAQPVGRSAVAGTDCR